MMLDHKISSRTNRVLNLFLMGLLFIVARIWYLSVLERETQLQNITRPQRRSVVERVERATIRDRFNIPLATNKIQYNVAVCYSHIRQIPSVIWKKEQGKTHKIQARKAHIEKLSALLAEELAMDPVQIEDLIHGKASLLPHTPFVIKENISEDAYYRLKLLEKDWLGLQVERSATRIYPQGKTACDVIGYIGMINSNEYYKIAEEIKELQNYLNEREEGKILFLPKGYKSPLEVRKRLKVLQEKAYTINDLIGKSGIEKQYDENLRGLCGKKTFEVDIKGNFLRELPGSRPAISGQRLVLSLSSELQQTAEELLSSYELYQDQRDQEKQISRRHPWQRGGAIIAMLPQTGEVVSLASYPRFDPNDFISSRDPQTRRAKRSQILKWLENEAHIGEIWDGKVPLSRELFDPNLCRFFEDTQNLNWEYYLDTVVKEDGSVRKAINKIVQLKAAIQLQDDIKELLFLSGQNSVRAVIEALYDGSVVDPVYENFKTHQDKVSAIKTRIDPYLQSISHHDDKLLLLDLIRVAANSDFFTPSLITAVGALTLSEFRFLSQSINRHLNPLETKTEELFHQLDFKNWRAQNFKKFLEQKRAEEKKEKKVTRPYPDYLALLEKKMFREFWEQNRLLLIETFILGKPATAAPELQAYFAATVQLRKEIKSDTLEHLKDVLSQLDSHLRPTLIKTFRPFAALTQPLWGKYRSLRNEGGEQYEKHLAASFYPYSGFGYARSQGFRQSTPQGSIFKLVIAYEALKKRYQELELQQRSLEWLNPLTLIDDLKWAPSNSNDQILGYLERGDPIKRLYKGGILPRSSHPNIGKVDLTQAIERSSNIYFSLLASDYIDQPMALENSAKEFNFGSKTGIELPGEYGGSVPNDLAYNKTGLYSFAIGQHALVVTPLQTAVMLSAIANGGKVLKPKIVQLAAGKEPSLEREEALFSRDDFPLKEDLSLVGINFPLFTQTLSSIKRGLVALQTREIKRTLFMPEKIRTTLLDGMHQVLVGSKGTARLGSIRSAYQDPKAIEAFNRLAPFVAGKTGTAEILYKQTLDADSKAEMEKHVWFGAISFKDEERKIPELVVVVYLRFGDAGKDAAPLALRVIDKWREINSSIP